MEGWLEYVHAAMKVYDSLFQVYFHVYYLSMLQQCLTAALLKFSVQLGQPCIYLHFRHVVQPSDARESISHL